MYDARSGLGPVLRREARPALAGLIAAGVSFGITEIFAGLISGGPSLIIAVGSGVIDLSPKFAKDFAIAVFGTNDKLALLISIVVIGLGLGAVVGVAGLRKFWIAQLGFVVFGIVAAIAGIAEPQLSPELALIGALLAASAGMWTLAMLLKLVQSAETPQPARDPSPMGIGRRPFMQVAGAFAVVAVGTAAGGRVLLERARTIASSRLDVILPKPRDAARPVPEGAMVDAAGIGPIITPNEDFYRIDTALSIPQVDLSSWTLKIEGLVDRPYELTYDELLDLSRVERHVTLCCVSNEVGGDLVDNAKWLGVPLTELLDRAGLQAEASQIVGMSVDGFTAGFPVDTVYDGRQALVAVGMNDEPLPLKHGFPARLVVAGLYGYVSATKWLDAIVVNRWEEFDGYWIPRGWSKEGPIKTQSRIDVPGNGRTLQPGLQPIAGVAWAQDRGISKVEVQIGDGGWQETQLGEAISKDTWLQWVLPWNATPGRHVIAVRATDATGETQTAAISSSDPDGATGHHTIVVEVSG